MPFSNISLSSTYTTTMKLTGDGRRPFAKDIFDLFSALVIQLQLGDHRSFFRNYPSTFTTDEAAQCLKALKFSHVIRTPDPATNGIRSTRTTTTFYMERDIAKALLQQFLNTRLITVATDSNARMVKDKSIWALTSKGKRMIMDFSERAYVSIEHMATHLSNINTVSILVLDRIKETDQLAFERENITLCFKTMMTKLPLENILADDVGGLHHHYLEEYTHTFYGKQCFEWIIQYTTVVNREEADMVAGELVLYGWIAHILDKSDLGSNSFDDSVLFRTSRNALYHITERGRFVLGWADSQASTKSVTSTSSSQNDVSTNNNNNNNKSLRTYPSLISPTDYERPASISNSETDVLTCGDDAAQFVRLRQILEDPLLRMYFRIYLKDNFCDENINFWVDYFAMRKKKKTQHTKNGMKDMISDCYAIYDTYIKEKSIQEVNIDHTLRQNIDTLVKSTFSIVSDPRHQHNQLSSTLPSSAPPFASPAITPHSTPATSISVNAPLAQCLHELMLLYDKVNDHLCRMMAQDSVPRFLRTSKYQKLLNAHLPPLPPQTSAQQDAEKKTSLVTNEKDTNRLDSVTQITAGTKNLTC
ncbi:uncharacterized protein BX664DRAFT_333984 [Halteromyces radiatus]|uniref:uncharacterized protein n=1 Tax=Halteromyces radiatus TaxID=101107 RepID=UPI00222062F9|nr:uncharacterized protein BX664DRAFT_333984 [Halteromyces radiatus]KAI8089818.1 hypothetical protein BX664DRAFT_333984 [Halteromyces radiatus]